MDLGQRERETESQRDRETVRDRETERQSETERQRDSQRQSESDLGSIRNSCDVLKKTQMFQISDDLDLSYRQSGRRDDS